MGETVIPLADLRYAAPVPAIPEHLTPASGLLSDRWGRPLRDLRISVTDRCNFRCVYCMPREVFGDDYAFLPRRQLLSFEEILRVARLFVARGVRKIRITGGEPLLRKDVDRLIGMLAALDGVEVTLTTNGVLLPKLARRLKDAGLHRVTVSLDALDDALDNVTTARANYGAVQNRFETVVGNLILGQFRAVQVQLYQIVMRADLGLVDVAWEQREEHNNRARMLAEEQNREISALNDEFSEVTEGAAPEDSQRLNNRSNAPSEPQSPPPPSTPQTGTTPAPVPGGTSAPTPPQAPTGEPQGQTR